MNQLRRHLVIVAAGRIDLHNFAAHLPDAAEQYEVHIDRRWGDRRQAGTGKVIKERRRGDRRHLDITGDLLREGWVIVPADQRA